MPTGDSTPLPGLDEGRRARDTAMDRAQRERGAAWDAAVIDQAVKHLASTGREFTADDLRDLLPPVGGSLIGTRIMVAARRRQIEKTGEWRPSRRPEAHARDLAVWRGTRHQAAPPAAAQRPARRRSTELEFGSSTDRSAPPRPMPIDDKAARLLVEGSVWVQYAPGDGSLEATVQGSRPHSVSRSRAGVWRCDCDAWQHDRPCSHIAAVRLVTTHPAERQAS